MKDLSIIIKTFIRLNCLERLLVSIPSVYHSIPILIFDDGKNADENKKYILRKFKQLKIEYIVCDEDKGLSYGRNVLLDRVKTKYFLLCDDDFIFNERTNLDYAVKKIEGLDADILGGVCLHALRVNFQSKMEKIELLLRKFQQIFGLYRKISYIGTIEKENNGIIFVNNPIKYNDHKVYRTDICENFFIGNTKKIKKVKWNDALKISEHEDFFIRCKNENVRVYLDNNFQIYHFPETNVNFQVKRNRTEFWKIVLQANNIKSLVIHRNNVGVVEKFVLQDDELNYFKKEKRNLKGFIKLIGGKILKK